MRRGFAVVLALLGLWASPVWAQAPTPVLVAKDYFTRDGREEQRALLISRLDIEVDIAGASARTVVTAQFQNPHERPLEGDFTLDLPPGSVITGYALNVGEAMWDGVLVGRRKGVTAYEEKVRAGIDPGFAEVTRTNAFHTRVFPVLAGEGRTIRVEFVSPLDPERGYVLPLVVAEPVGAVSVKLTADAPKGVAGIIAPSGLPLTWKPVGDRLEATGEARGVSLSGALEVRPPERAQPVVMTRHGSGDIFFEIDDVATGQSDAADVGRVRVYWDTSLSRRDDDLAGEIALLRRYIVQAKPRTIDLVLFADGKPVVRTFSSADDVETALRSVTYRGATSIERLFRTELPRAGACLYFSDGRVTLDPYRAERAGCPLFAVSSAPDADRGFMETLARKSNGDYLDLTVRSADEALPILLREAPRVVSVTTTDGQDVDYRVLPAAPGRLRIIGRAPPSPEIRMRLLGASDGSRVYELNTAQPRKHDGAGALWAVGQVAEMGATDQPDENAILTFAQRYSVATPSAVFLVLEDAGDYVEADVEPPANAGKAFLESYREMAADRDADRAEERADRFEVVLEAWEDRKEWWRTRYPLAPPPRAKRPVPAPPPGAGAAGLDDAGGVEALIVTAQRREENIQDVPTAISAFSQESLEGSQVAGGPDLITQVPTSTKTITVEMEEWRPDRPYLKALAEASPETFWSVYGAQEREYGSLPAFYLDVGEFLFRAGRAQEARSVALGALELPTADTGTLAIMADRMMRYGDPARAIWLYEKIRFLEPDRPQPHRDLALALVERVEKRMAGAEPRRDYVRALELLSEVILTPWDGDYDGIELIALMEANRLVPRLRALGVKPKLDPRLTALLDVDVRVVLEWNTDASDMDLWVHEPTGEQAMYSRPLTTIGGRMSNDMTEGYGPEEYLLRRAPRGRYEVRVNVYNVDRLNPNGATTVRARIYRAWGRPEESSETLEIELKPDGERNALVGAITVERQIR